MTVLDVDHAQLDPLDLAVDPPDEGVDDSVCGLIDPADLRRRRAIDADAAVDQVTLHILRAEHLCLATEGPSPESIHLPEAVLGHCQAEAEIEVGG